MDTVTQESFDTVMAFMGAMGAGDMEKMRALMADDMVWHNEGDESLQPLGTTQMPLPQATPLPSLER